MNTQTGRSSLQLHSTAKKNGDMELSLATVTEPSPGPDEVMVRIDAAPINPSDLGLLLGAADWNSAKVAGTRSNPIVTAPMTAKVLQAMAARIDIPMPVGNEGAGVVIEAGKSEAAQALMGKTVAVLGGAMYSQFRRLNVNQCLVLPPGATVPNYLVFAILTTVFCCLPTGIPAIVFAAQVNGKVSAGDIAGAQAASEKAKMWCWISFGVGLAVNIISVLVNLATITAALKQGGH